MILKTPPFGFLRVCKNKYSYSFPSFGTLSENVVGFKSVFGPFIFILFMWPFGTQKFGFLLEFEGIAPAYSILIQKYIFHVLRKECCLPLVVVFVERFCQNLC